MFSPRWLFLYPGIALVLLGLIVMVLLLPGQLTIGEVRLDVHTLVYASAAIIVGYQAILFALFARTYAMTQGFLPRNPRIDKLLDRLTLEAGVSIGILLVVAGLTMSLIAFFTWGRGGFQDLDYRDTMRLVIPASTTLMLGVQTVFASFFFSIIGIRRSPSNG